MIDIKDRKNNIPIYIALILPVFTGLGTNVANVVSLIELVLLLYYFDSDKFWFFTPIFCLYHSQLLLVGERLELFTLFSAVCILRMFWYEKRLKRSGMKNKMVFFILMLYSCFVMMAWGEMWLGIQSILKTIAVSYAVYCIHRNKNLCENLKRVIVFMSISAAIYGVIFENIKGKYEEQDTLVQYGVRYSGTTSDPNYMAFYYCIAFCFLLFMKMEHQWLKRFVLFALFVAMTLTGSLTGLLTIVLVMILYVLLAKESKWISKVLTTLLICALTVFFIWYIFSGTTEVEILDLYRTRILQKIDFMNQGDMAGVTTGRTELSEKYIKYLMEQNVFRIMFGGYQLNAMGLIGEAFDTIRWGAHNSYVDVLMTSGVVGLMFFVGAIINKGVKYLKEWSYTKNTSQIEGFVYVIIVAFFLAGLSVFPSPNYMFFIML